MSVAHKPPSLWRLLLQPEQAVTVYFLIYIMNISLICRSFRRIFWNFQTYAYCLMFFSSTIPLPRDLGLYDFNPLKCAAVPCNPEYGLYVFSDVLGCLKKLDSVYCIISSLDKHITHIFCFLTTFLVWLLYPLLKYTASLWLWICLISPCSSVNFYLYALRPWF